MTLQRRLKKIMNQRGWRVADLARALGVPYTTVREWVLKGRAPIEGTAWQRGVDRAVGKLERPVPY